jgi:O-antigen/teichoic acid export membrane protein
MSTTLTFAYNIVYRVLNIAVVYAIVVVFSRQAGVEGYGILSLMIVNTAFFNLVSGFGADAGITFHSAEKNGLYPGKITSLIFIILLLQLFILVIAELSFHWLTGQNLVFKGSSSSYWGIGLMLLLGISLTEKYTSLFNGHHLFVLYGRVIFFTNLAVLLVLSFFLLYHPLHNATRLIFLYAVLYLFQSFVLMYIFHRRIKNSWQFPRVDWKDLQVFLSFSLVALVSNLIQFLCYRMDYWFVEYFRGAKELGWYAFASRLAQAFWMLPTLFAGILFSQVAQKKEAYRKEDMLLFMRVLFCINIIAGVVSFLVLPFIIVFIFGNIYNESVLPFRILLPGMILFCNTTVLAAYFAGRNSLRVNLAGSALCFVSILVADILLIPSFGMKGAAIASSIGYSLSCIFSVAVYCRQTGTPVGQLFYPRAADWKNLRLALNKIILKKA